MEKVITDKKKYRLKKEKRLIESANRNKVGKRKRL